MRGRPRRDRWHAISASGQFVVRHSAGVTRFSRATRGIRHELDVFVDVDDPVKFSLLTLTNDGRHDAKPEPLCLQRLGARPATGEPGRARHHDLRRDERDDPRAKCLQRRVCAARRVRACQRDADVRRRAIVSRSSAATVRCTDRLPLRHLTLEPQFGAGLDPCAALHVQVALDPGERRRVLFLLGQGTDPDHVDRLIARHRRVDDAMAALQKVQAVLEHDARDDPGPHPGRFIRRADESVARLSGPELPSLDARGLLPARRSVRLSRSIAGRDGAAAGAARSRQSAPAPGGRPAVRRRRRPALVA